MNRGIVFSVVGLVIIGVGVSLLKYEVVFMRKNLKMIQQENGKMKEDIRVLAAEWSCLNSPRRLEKLAQKHLPNMKPVVNKQIIKYNKIIESGLIPIHGDKESPGSSGSSFDALLDGIMEEKSTR
jgi:cell division protein FtsL